MHTLLELLVAALALLATAPASRYDPLAWAAAHDEVENREAPVPPVCYTKTGGTSNPCWACHTDGLGKNHASDWELQERYAFSETARANHWTNLFVDRRGAIAAIADDEALAWVRQDNYRALRRELAARPGYEGYRPDLDLDAGVDAEGFAVDGSGWRALRYKPFLGAFFPTNGSSDDVFVRLPEPFRVDAAGRPSRAVYRLNLAILEAAIATPPPPLAPAAGAARAVEPVDETLAGVDLDGDGAVGGTITVIRRLPTTYAGGAAAVPVTAWQVPAGTELLHTVRYPDPDAPGLLSRRLKELRYSRKLRVLDDWGLVRAYEREANEKAEGLLPVFAGDPASGLHNDFGWLLQGFIEDQRGRLRVQTREETLFCMGCHSNLGVTVDQTFSLARKLPGAEGWRHQDLAGQRDVPQAGHCAPEILTYLARVGGGDELRANDEILARFFPGGRLDEAEVRRAATGGDRDLAWLLAPSRARALALIKAYMLIVREQSFTRGRDAVLAAAANVHARIDEEPTALAGTGRVRLDGRLWLDWDSSPSCRTVFSPRPPSRHAPRAR
jgi:hypothetical protein